MLLTGDPNDAGEPIDVNPVEFRTGGPPDRASTMHDGVHPKDQASEGLLVLKAAVMLWLHESVPPWRPWNDVGCSPQTMTPHVVSPTLMCYRPPPWRDSLSGTMKNFFYPFIL